VSTDAESISYSNHSPSRSLAPLSRLTNNPETIAEGEEGRELSRMSVNSVNLEVLKQSVIQV
jgi:hypothetical protein